MIEFFSPAFLWGLLALAVPLAIHLWNRRTGKRILVGSIQWLQMAENARLSQLRLNQIGLLVLRLLVLATWVLLMAKPIWPFQSEDGKVAEAEKWVIASVRQAGFSAIGQQIGQFQAEGFSWRLPSRGFPEAPSAETLAEKETAPLAREPRAIDWLALARLGEMPKPPDTVVVIAPLLLSQLPKHLPTLPPQLRWVVVPQEKPAYMLLGGRQGAEGKRIWLASTDEHQTQIWQIVAKDQGAVQIEGLPTLRITHDSVALVGHPEERLALAQDQHATTVWIDADPAYAEDLGYLKAALRATADYAQAKVLIEEGRPKEGQSTDLYIWYKDEPPLAQGVSTTNWLILNGQASAKANKSPLAREGADGRHYLNYRINPSVNPSSLSYQLPELLLELLFADKDWQSRLQAKDRRQLGEDFLAAHSATQADRALASFGQSEQQQDPPKKAVPTELLWGVLMVLMLSERIVAYKTQS